MTTSLATGKLEERLDDPMSWQMQLQVSLERPESDAETARLLRSWFSGAFEAMGGQLRQDLLAAEPLSDDMLRKRRIDEPFGQPGEVWGQFSTGVRGPGGLRYRTKAFSVQSWQVFLRGFDSVPFSANLKAVTLDDDGFPNAFPVFEVNAGFNEEFRPAFRQYDGRWLFLSVRFGPRLLDDLAYQRATLAFVREVADTCNPAYGEISYDRGSGRSAFESVFGGLPGHRAPTSRQFLRGYAWLTLCPEEIGARLGGVDGLRASGAFAEVDRLAAGGYWLLATPDYRAFSQEVAERMFPVLAPALPAGEPRRVAPDDPPYLVSRRNAAELAG